MFFPEAWLSKSPDAVKMLPWLPGRGFGSVEIKRSGKRCYILYEAESAEAYGAFNLPWSDICVIDSVPVMEASEFMQLLPKYQKKA